ncbi:family 16 glycoside hydrolase [Novipirellula maiorica]|nr:family 16 glycoside hydrolase [Rhodopirellula maiorica]
MKMRLSLTIAGLCLACLPFGSRPADAAESAPADDANQLTESEKRSGWELLFDGSSTEGWRNYKRDDVSDGWKVQDGALVRHGKGAGDLITEEKFDTFELSLQYKISKEGNSGLMFHVVESEGRPYYSGPEIQIQDNKDGHDPQKAGWLYQLYKPGTARGEETPIDATRPAGQWNELYLRIGNDQCSVCMNGVRYYNFKIGDKTWKDRVAASKFAQWEGFGEAGKGHICLQDHGDLVSYRNIKIRRLEDDQPVKQPIDGKLGMKSVLAFPNLQWDQWQAVDDAGQVRPLRLIELTYAKDAPERLYAISQRGMIWSFENKPDVTESQLVLDLREKVYDWKKRGANEQGLLGLALHPDFKSNQKFYVYYSLADAEKSILSCFTMSKDNPHQADPKSEVVLMEIDQPFQNHNGGSIEFGPDGYLYIGLGDGGLRNDPYEAGQDLGKILGKILRIDVDNAANGKNYAIPADNPFVNTSGALPEIYAYGLRNPWRIAFDPASGRLWAGDVGQESWEEVDVITKGGNYGWSSREGTHPFGSQPVPESVSEPIEPVWEYDHAIGKSITGGRVYRSDRNAELTGKYIYADYVTGSVWALSYDPETGKATRNDQVLPDSIPVLAFGQDASGEVYYLTNSVRGECIYRFDAAK